MQLPQDLVEKAFQLITKSQRILIISHRNPDADTIGSNLALREILKKKGKEVISACVDVPPRGVSLFLRDADCFQQDFDPAWPELIICVDAGSPSQVAFIQKYPSLLDGTIPVLNIDHHASNDNYGTLNIVVGTAASATIVLYCLLKLWNEHITSNIATCLLYGLYYDTGSFMHSNTNEEVYEIGSELLQKGANLEAITRNLFHQHEVNQLRLWGKVLSEAEMNEKNIIVAGVTAEDFQNYQAKTADLSGVINYLSMAKGNLFAAVLSEDGKGNIRGSLRTKEDDINLSDLASVFGGGGHKKASGFTLEGSLKKESYWKIQ